MESAVYCLISVAVFHLVDTSSIILFLTILWRERMSWCEKFGFHVDHCKSLLTNSKNCSTHFVTYKHQSLSFGCRGTVGYLTCSTSRVFLPTCDDLADHTSFRHLTILRSTVFRCFCRESSIINVMLGSVLTITKIQW